MNFKKGLIYLFIFILTINIIYAAEENSEMIKKASEYLKNNANWDTDVSTVDFMIYSLANTGNKEKAQEGLNELLDRKDDSASCWPNNNCKVKDTALTLLALNKFGKPITETVTWLNNAKIPAMSQGTWWIQIESPEEATCTFSYNNLSKSFHVANDRITECGNQQWVDIERCVQSGLTSKLEQLIDINCDNANIISLIYQISNDYYLFQEFHSNKATLKINNACWGTTSSSASCDYESTVFASWVLDSFGKPISTEAYLESREPQTTPEYSLMYVINGKTSYSDWLSHKQNLNGNWEDVYSTAFAYYAFKDKQDTSNISEWLSEQQNADGSWNSNLLDTSVTLFALVADKGVISSGETKGVSAYCGDGTCDSDEDDISCPQDCVVAQCGNNVIEGFEECDGAADTACPGECSLECKCPTKATCVSEGYSCCDKCTANSDKNDFDGDCSKYDQVCCIECSYEVSEIEKSCSDEVDDDNDGLIDCEDSDCSEDSACKGVSSKLWLWLLIILLVLLVIGLFGYYYYKEYYLKGKKPKFGEFFNNLKEKIKGIFKKGKKEQPQMFGRPASSPFRSTPSRPEPRPQIPFFSQSQSRSRKSEIEDELEKSLREAKKLIKRK